MFNRKLLQIILFTVIGMILGTAIGLLWNASLTNNLSQQVDHRGNFFPKYYELNIPGGGLWCSPIKTRLSGASVFVVHKSAKDKITRLLMTVETRYENGKPMYFAGAPIGFYDPEYGDRIVKPHVLIMAERLLYESHLKKQPISVTEAYKKAHKKVANNEKYIEYSPDEDLLDTAYRETIEETGLDLKKYDTEKRLKNWKLINISENKSAITAFYYGEITTDDPPVLKPQEADIKKAEWVPLTDISLKDNTAKIQGQLYPLRTKNIPKFMYEFLEKKLIEK